MPRRSAPLLAILLRQLAKDISELAHTSTAYSVVNREIDVMIGYLCARAAIIELNEIIDRQNHGP